MFLDPPAGCRIVRRRIHPSEEGRRILRRCHPCRCSDAAPTFEWRSGSPEVSWHRWLKTVFEPVLGPALVAALHHARLGHFRELVQIDQALDLDLPVAEAVRSRWHGHRLVLSMLPPSGVRVLWRYRRAVAENRTPGHLAIGFALRAAAFHVSTRAAAAAYLQCEWQDATGDDALPPGPVRLTGLPVCPASDTSHEAACHD